ncbi:flagellar protein FliS [Anaerosolibacter carboniphilus]|uniref:Flagellar protein FliS n=1 Tax=Anaerosolibacter carboniphilus TaxID=1417629 RepID=A0A841KZV2_9FIRM|nr:flagellar export chaperone FliS [Anaerosolibacter carboniphilus]MBB6216442.1 flagellar protein FliS [Anaerosolibacter carboniphilus]
MALNNPYKQYQQNNVTLASPQELTLMLYNGAIKFIHLAMQGIDERNIEKSHNAIIRTTDIITELNVTLNMNYEISKQLRALYDFINSHLIEANMKKDRKKLEEALEITTTLRDAWKEAMVLAKKG